MDGALPGGSEQLADDILFRPVLGEELAEDAAQVAALLAYSADGRHLTGAQAPLAHRGVTADLPPLAAGAHAVDAE